jgi:hypothetical protein
MLQLRDEVTTVLGTAAEMPSVREHIAVASYRLNEISWRSRETGLDRCTPK